MNTARLVDLSKTGPQRTDSFRFMPLLDGRPAASMWMFWVQRDELYALRRTLGEVSKISVHQSGQIHMRLGYKHVHLLDVAQATSVGLWKNACDLRFLIDSNCLRPTEEKRLKAKHKAFGVEIIPGHALDLSLLIAPKEESFLQIPKLIWMASFKDGRRAALICRMVPFSEGDHGEFERANETTINLNNKPSKFPYAELTNYARGINGGNVILVRPVSLTTFRWPGDRTNMLSDLGPQTISVSGSDMSLDIFAPQTNVQIASLIIRGASTIISVIPGGKGSKAVTGQATLRLNAENLVFGNTFRLTPQSFRCATMIEGATARDPSCTLNCWFDGVTLSIEILSSSFTLRNANTSPTIRQLGNDLQIIVQTPAPSIKLSTSKTQPLASAAFTSLFQLQQI